MGRISGRLKRSLWPLVEVRMRELEPRRPRKRTRAVGVCSILFIIMFLLGSAGVTAAGPGTDDFQFTIENEIYRETPPGPTPEPESGSAAPISPSSVFSYTSPTEPTQKKTSDSGGGSDGTYSDFTVDISPDSRTILNKIWVIKSLSLNSPREERESYNGRSVNRKASYTVTVTSVNGFSGTVELSLTGVPSNASAPLPSSVSVPRNGSVSITLTVTTTSSTPKGSYTLTASGYSTAVSGLLLLPTSHPEYGASGVTRSDSAKLEVEETNYTNVDDVPLPEFHAHDKEGYGSVSGYTADGGIVTGTAGIRNVSSPTVYADTMNAAAEDCRKKGGVGRAIDRVVDAIDTTIIQPAINKVVKPVVNKVVKPVVKPLTNIAFRIVNFVRAMRVLFPRFSW